MHLVTLKTHVIFDNGAGFPSHSSVEWWYTGVPLSENFMEVFFLLFFHLSNGLVILDL